jgi:hypothetical protein
MKRCVLLVVLVACACPNKPTTGPSGTGGVGSGTGDVTNVGTTPPTTGASTCDDVRTRVEQLYRADAQAKEPKRVDEAVADNTAMVMNDCKKDPAKLCRASRRRRRSPSWSISAWCRSTTKVLKASAGETSAGTGCPHMMKNLASIAMLFALASCGSKQTPVQNQTGDTGSAAPPADTRSEIERRRDAACTTLGPRMTACAVEDSKTQFAEGKIPQKDYDFVMRKDVQAKYTEQTIEKCKKPETEYSSRQIRVLEVCQKEETECGPLLACLDNLNKQQ